MEKLEPCSRLSLQRINISFPIAAIKGDAFVNRQRARIDAAQVYAPRIGVTARAVEGFYAADPAEHMHGLARVKSVFRQRVFTREKAQFFLRDEHMFVACHIAHGAAAIRHINGGRCVEFKPHCAAMTAAPM